MSLNKTNVCLSNGVTSQRSVSKLQQFSLPWKSKENNNLVSPTVPVRPDHISENVLFTSTVFSIT